MGATRHRRRQPRPPDHSRATVQPGDGAPIVTQPRPLTIPALLAQSARAFGPNTYVVTPTERLTYEEAEQRSAHVARWLLHEGVGKGSRVGLFFTNGVEWITWWLALSRIGALTV